MKTKIFSFIAVLILAVVVVIYLRPDDFRVTRSATMKASPEIIMEQITDFHKWEAWSPWAKLDPNAKNTFSGTESGVGAIFHWDGNNEVGEGEMQITEVRSNEAIVIKIDFFKPMKGTNTVEFTFKPEGDQTLVTWSMFGKSDFIGKAFSLVINCDKMIGDMYEKGLTNLKTVVEKP
jgi:uncharacterized protein YndB with AHSA1/START domain